MQIYRGAKIESSDATQVGYDVQWTRDLKKQGRGRQVSGFEVSGLPGQDKPKFFDRLKQAKEYIDSYLD